MFDLTARAPTSRTAPTAAVLRRCACGGVAGPDGECAECRAKRLRRSAEPAADPSVAPASVHAVLATPGHPLEPGVRGEMESRFGYDFGRVRVHADGAADASSRAVRAAAYTVGSHVAFRAERYPPRDEGGHRLLAHELAHVVQQRGAEPLPGEPLRIGETDAAEEREAERAAAAPLSAAGFHVARRAALRVARQGMDAGAPPPAARPVFFCSKSVALGGKHAFFRIGGAGPGNPTYELEHDEYGQHCQCGIQGHPTRDYPEDRDSADATCVAAPTVSASCLDANWASYPIGKYCALGPNSNTYAATLGRSCGAGSLRPPGWLPGFDDAPPPTHTANPALDARATFLPGGCQTIDCDDDVCRRIYF